VGLLRPGTVRRWRFRAIVVPAQPTTCFRFDAPPGGIAAEAIPRDLPDAGVSSGTGSGGGIPVPRRLEQHPRPLRVPTGPPAAGGGGGAVRALLPPPAASAQPRMRPIRRRSSRPGRGS
jgi:hypothetical protein